MAWGGIRTRIKPVESGSTPSTVADLTLALEGIANLDAFYTRPTNAAYERFRFREVGQDTWSAPLRLSGTVTLSVTLKSETDYEGQVQGTGDGGKRGAWSNTATFSTPDLSGEETGEVFDVNVRQNYTGGAGGSELYGHTLAAVATAVNEGSPVQWDYTLAKNGGSNETYTIRVRTVQPSLPTGSYSQTIVESCQAVSETGVTFIGNGTPTDLTFLIDPALFDGTFRISRATSAISGNQGAITSISNASPGVVTTPSAHGMAADQPLRLTTTGALPTGLATGTTYYVRSPTSTTFQLSATAGGASINTSTAGSGTHTFHVRSGLLIEAVSAGTNNTPTGQLVTITDTFTAAPEVGDLSYLTLSSDYLNGPDINTGSPVAIASGTTIGVGRVGEILGWDVDDEAVPLASCTLLNTVDGRFKVTQETTHFYLDVDSGGPIDFLNLTGANRQPIMFYSPTISAADAGAIGATLTPLIRERFPKVAPTGDLTANVLTQDTMTELYSTLPAAGDNATVQISSAWVDVAEATNATELKLRRSNATYVGHRRWAAKHKKGWVWQQGNNIIVKDFAFRVDGSFALRTTDPASKEIDNLQLAYKGTAMLRNIEFINCSFSTSNDELARVKGNSGWYAHGVKFTRCLFAFPFYDSGHPKGTRHNLGPAISPGNRNVVFDRCLLIGMSTRMPRCNRSTGFTVRNCLIARWLASETYGGIMCAQGNVGAGLEIMTARLEANLFDAPANGSVTGRYGAINLENLNNVNTAYVYIPSTGNYRNTFIDMETSTFTPDYLSVGDGIALHTGISSAESLEGVIRNTAPYELADDYGMLPTATEANIIALKDDILNYVGVRARVGDVHTGALISGDDALNAWDYDVVHTYRTTGTGIRDYTPTMATNEYGSTWNGPGTTGRGMAALP